MFGIFTSEQKRAQRDAHNWLHLAHKVYHFRRDLLPPQELQALQQGIHDLKSRLQERADAAKLKMAIERLEGALRRSGGAYYPKSSLVENAEFFLVALILFLGIRTFLIQPFKIPTNSMWPTYHGMTAEVYVDSEDERLRSNEPGTVEFRSVEDAPDRLQQTIRLLLFGASSRRMIAPIDGEIRIPYRQSRNNFIVEIENRLVSKRRWLIFPGQARQYTLLVGDRPVTVTVPIDFRFEQLVQKTFFRNNAEFEASVRQAQRTRRSNLGFVVDTGRHVRSGESALSFDILTGDQLFVDRVSYHFVRPKVGDGFVFRTNHIPWLEGATRDGPMYLDRYYIKRLVGVPGDTLAVRDGVLIRNGEPISGAAAFEKNARREAPYRGYTNEVGHLLAANAIVTVEPRSFFAMGDNSPDSADSRVWGFVPEADVVGRPLFVYYPFTRRWGPAR